MSIISVNYLLVVTVSKSNFLLFIWGLLVNKPLRG